jgi:hypothetical protein
MDEATPLSADQAMILTNNLLSIIQHSNETSRRLPVADRRALARGIGRLHAALAARDAEIARLQEEVERLNGLVEYFIEDGRRKEAR